MKKLSALLLLALGLSVIPAGFSADKKPAATKPATAAKPAAATAATPEAAEDTLDEKNLVGVLLTRANGTFVNIKVADGKFTMAFYDAAKKPMEPDVPKAVVRFRKDLKNHRHLLVSTGDGKTLQAPTPVARPFIFNTAQVVLLSGAEEASAETFTVNFKQPMPGDGATMPADEMTPEQLQMLAP